MRRWRRKQFRRPFAWQKDSIDCQLKTLYLSIFIFSYFSVETNLRKFKSKAKGCSSKERKMQMASPNARTFDSNSIQILRGKKNVTLEKKNKKLGRIKPAFKFFFSLLPFYSRQYLFPLFRKLNFFQELRNDPYAPKIIEKVNRIKEVL